MTRSILTSALMSISLLSCQIDLSPDTQSQNDTNTETYSENPSNTDTNTETSTQPEIEANQCNTFNPDFIHIDELTVNIVSETLVSCNNNYNWVLDMGDGVVNINEESAISHTYTNYGQYTITLIDEDNNFVNNYSTIINLEQSNTQTQTTCDALDSVDIKNISVTDLLTININADNTYYGCDTPEAQIKIESTQSIAFTRWNQNYSLNNGDNSIELPFMGTFLISTDIQKFYITLTENEYQISDFDENIISQGLQQEYPDCYWTLTHIAQNIYNLSVNNNDQCEQLVQSTNPTINWGDGSELEQFELGYITHIFNDKVSNLFAADYIIEINSNNPYISDIKHIIENKYGETISVNCGISGTTSLYAYGENFYAYPQQISSNPVAFTLLSSTSNCATNIQGSTGQSNKNIDFGDNSEPTTLPTNNSSIWHIYPSAGQYSLPLVSDQSVSQIDVTDEINTNAPFSNCEDSSDLITLLDSPNDLSNDNLLRDFNASSLLTSKDGCTYWNSKQFNWDFGDGAKYTNTDATISHQFLEEGIYPVTVEAGSVYSTVSRTKLYNANSLAPINDPIACRIIAPEDNLNISITSNALAIEIDTSNLSFTQTNPCDSSLTAKTATWDFGDGTTVISDETFISHTYAQAGEYAITLIIGFEEDFVTIKKTITIE